jgi:predicted nuclease with TOPRIM domain
MSDMETRLRQRLEELRAEYEKGKKTVEDLEGQAANVRATLLRISGAIQVLQEELDAGEGSRDALPPA